MNKRSAKHKQQQTRLRDSSCEAGKALQRLYCASSILAEPLRPCDFQDKPWNSKAPWFLLSLFAAGATLGPALDGIHGTVHLLKYDSAQFQLGDVESSGWVALLLGTFYAVIGSLHIVGDHWQSTADPQHQQQLNTNQSLPYLLASIGWVRMSHMLKPLRPSLVSSH